MIEFEMYFALVWWRTDYPEAVSSSMRFGLQESCDILRTRIQVKLIT